LKKMFYLRDGRSCILQGRKLGESTQSNARGSKRKTEVLQGELSREGGKTRVKNLRGRGGLLRGRKSHSIVILRGVGGGGVVGGGGGRGWGFLREESCGLYEVR